MPHRQDWNLPSPKKQQTIVYPGPLTWRRMSIQSNGLRRIGGVAPWLPLCLAGWTAYWKIPTALTLALAWCQLLEINLLVVFFVACHCPKTPKNRPSDPLFLWGNSLEGEATGKICNSNTPSIKLKQTISKLINLFFLPAIFHFQSAPHFPKTINIRYQCMPPCCIFQLRIRRTCRPWLLAACSWKWTSRARAGPFWLTGCEQLGMCGVWAMKPTVPQSRSDPWRTY